MKVSYFKNVKDTTPKDYDLDQWLKNTINPPKELKSLVKKYRNLKTKSLKSQIPCITVSATFKNYRNLDHIKNKTRLICLDIDRDNNICADMELVRDLFKSHPSVLYSGLSISKNGVYVIVRLGKGKLLKYFKHFKRVLSKKGINIDDSCKDYTRLRFFSVDKEAYYNPEATVFNLPKKIKNKSVNNVNTASLNDTQKVEQVIALIEQHSIDVTSNYSDWVKIAGAFQNSFGEHGRDYFHRVSRFHSEYHSKKCDRKYNSCRKMNKVNLSSFFYIADMHGIRY